MNREKIAFFDSGVGGLTVFNELKLLLPNENYLYFGDLANTPYGEKSKDELIVFADKIFKFFESNKVKAVVMACNTTSANVYEELKNNYNFKIYPIIQSCAKVISAMGASKIGVFATNATVKSGAYSHELKKYNPALEVFEYACPKWVKIVENNLLNDKNSFGTINADLQEMLKFSPDKIILGCTHYPYLLNILTSISKDIFIDPAKIFAEYIYNDLVALDLLSDLSGSENFYVSATPEKFKNAASVFYQLDDLPQLIRL